MNLNVVKASLCNLVCESPPGNCKAWFVCPVKKQLVTNVTSWLQTLQAGYKRYKLVTNVTSWLQTLQAGYKRYKLVTNVTS